MKRSNIYFLVFVFCHVTAVLFLIDIFPSIFPQKYYFDSNVIQRAIDLTSLPRWGDSFSVTSYFYKLLGFSSDTSKFYAGLVNYLLINFMLVPLYGMYWRSSYSWTSMVYFSVWFLVYGIYLGQYSKEVLISILTTLIVYLFISNLKEKNQYILTILIIMLVAFLFRAYWGLILIYFVIIYRYMYSIKKLVVAMSVVTMALSLITSQYLGGYLSDIGRSTINYWRDRSDDFVGLSNSQIDNIFVIESVLHDLINIFITVIKLVLPLGLILKMDIKYLLFSGFIIANFFLWLQWYKLNLDTVLRVQKEYSGVRISLAFLLAFLVVQAIFEGDYGTFFRHQVALYPIYLYLLVKISLLGRREAS